MINVSINISSEHDEQNYIIWIESGNRKLGFRLEDAIKIMHILNNILPAIKAHLKDDATDNVAIGTLFVSD